MSIDENMQIRAFEEKDIDNCAQLFAQVFSSEPWNEPWTASSASTRIRHFFDESGFRGLVGYEGEKLLGFVLGNLQPWLDEKQFRIEEFCVQPNLQKRKVGSTLLQKLHERMRAEGITSINLITSPDGPAFKFFLANRYVESARASFMHFDLLI